MAHFEKILKCFQSSSDCLYGRTEESEAIKKFIEGDDHILHITGNPGTGKTHTVLWTLKCLAASQNNAKPETNKTHKNTRSSAKTDDCFRYVYLNYLAEKSINCRLREHLSEYKKRRSNSKALEKYKNCNHSDFVLVVDEFDKYYEENKKECLKNIHLFLNNGFKIITISNNLKMGTIRFSPYSATNIVEILQEKMEKEIGEQVVDHIALDYLVKKYGNGDLRAVMKKVAEIFLKARAAGEGNCRIRLADVIGTQEKQIEKGVHHEIILAIKENEPSEKVAYQKYLKECDTLSLAVIEKQEFEVIFDFL